jgi:xanthine dehydrogenase accessory factor
MLVQAPIIASEWLKQGRRVVAAMLVGVEGSAPLELGATMLVDNEGHIEGSVTGGCVEGALVEQAQEVLAGQTPRITTYGISDGDAVGVGLMCGGTVHIFVYELGASSQAAVTGAASALYQGQPVATATLLDGPQAGASVAVIDDELLGSFGHADLLDHAVREDARGALDHGMSLVRRYGATGEIMGDDLRVYIHAYVESPSMIVFGAIDFSAAVAALAKVLGYRVTICDARRPFLESSRFRVADQLVADWPDRYLAGKQLGKRDVVLVFTHDPKFDEPALRAALATDAGYIGALGSRKTQQDRVHRLIESGVDPGALERIAAPCGLDIGARTPSETAISILAEIITHASGRRGEPLSRTTGSIHPARLQPARSE